MPTYYEILDVASNASVGQIRDALQKEEIRLSLILDRPDEGGRVEAERRVVVLSTVEQTLLDANARANYDRQLARIPTARAASLSIAGCR